MLVEPIIDVPVRALRANAGARPVTVTDGLGVSRTVDLYSGGLPRTDFGDIGPQAFLAHLHPDDVVPAHFHQIDQFQVLFGAPGARYQRTEIPAGTVVVHYTDAFSVYGPITCGAAGLDFFTLREQGHSYTGYMPAARADLVRRGRRNVHHAFVPSEISPLVTRGGSELVLVADDDDLRVTVGAANQGELVPVAAFASGAGQFYVVVEGEVLDRDERRFGPTSLAWVPPGEPGLGLRAASPVAQILTLQFPHRPR